MKKPVKKSDSNKNKTPRGQRHAPSGSKPVTIDLKAEKVGSKPDNSSKKVTSASASKPAPTKSSVTPNQSQKTTAEPASTSKAKPSGNENASDTSKPSQSRSQPSVSQRFIPALIGGVVALAGAGLLQYVGILGSPGRDMVSVDSFDQQRKLLTERISQLEGSVNTISTNTDTAVIGAQIDQRLQKWGSEAEADSDIDAIANQVNETTLRVEKLISDQRATEDSIALLESAISAGTSGESIAVGVIDDRLEAASGRIDKLGAELSSLQEGFTELSTETKEALLVAKETAAKSETNNQSDTSLNDNKQVLAALIQRLISLESSTKQLPGYADDLKNLKGQVEKASQSLVENKGAVEDIRKQLANLSSTDNFAARAVAAAALKNDIDQGASFADSLATLRRLAPDDAPLADLEAYAQSGVPTTSQLLSEFTTLADSILEELEPEGDDTLSSRLIAGVKKFVKVKPTAPIEGDTPRALVSQIIGALAKGDLKQASDRWALLPENGRTLSAQWHTKLQSRMAANDLITKAVQSYLNATTLQ